MLQNAHSLFFRQNHIAERPSVWLRESPFAVCAAVALQLVSVLPELLSGLVAGWAVHFSSSAWQRKSVNLFKHRQEKNGKYIYLYFNLLSSLYLSE
jgi:hypothetical protein